MCSENPKNREFPEDLRNHNNFHSSLAHEIKSYCFVNADCLS